MNPLVVAVAGFAVVYSFIWFVRPGFLYHPERGLSAFGVGYRYKTIMPLWLVAVGLGILCYLGGLHVCSR